ncbi:MAG TPA: efflux RND transporter periplasmic adaptor subunit, partial [Ideonella sp.]|nr:efflux RND transporter periplasmic adaptor subunit [Ideonella sp.]
KKVVLRIGEGDKLDMVPVTVGRTLGDVVEVNAANLKRGDRIVLSPGDKLAAGAAVSVVAK